MNQSESAWRAPVVMKVGSAPAVTGNSVMDRGTSVPGGRPDEDGGQEGGDAQGANGCAG